MRALGAGALGAFALTFLSSRDASAAEFVWPQGGTITSTYYDKRYYGYHGADDIAGPNLSTTVAARGGTVHYAGWSSGYGNLVILDHEAGYQTYYGHNHHFYVSKGAHVSMGSGISAEGTTGYSTGPHCHFEVRRYGYTKVVPAHHGEHVTKGADTGAHFPGLSSTAPSSPHPPAPASTHRTLVYGMRGSDVLLAQHLLHDKGYFFGPFTGYFGPITLAAVKHFQHDHGISATGSIGPITWPVLLR
ncbi:peptidoglycan DD-metalloendopeptidase family protein [bacterium]|nr:peptidoglycan DD-metalloendopeptidase family protein [bacterium]